MAQEVPERRHARTEGGIRKVQPSTLTLVKWCECRGLRIAAAPRGEEFPYDRVETRCAIRRVRCPPLPPPKKNSRQPVLPRISVKPLSSASSGSKRRKRPPPMIS